MNTPTHPHPVRITRAGWAALIIAAVLLGFVTAPHVGTAAYRSTVNHHAPTQTHTTP